MESHPHSVYGLMCQNPEILASREGKLLISRQNQHDALKRTFLFLLCSAECLYAMNIHAMACHFFFKKTERFNSSLKMILILN